MIIDGSGNVGIGTTNPGNQLSISNALTAVMLTEALLPGFRRVGEATGWPQRLSTRRHLKQNAKGSSNNKPQRTA
jgi:hypothetical protein